MGGLFYVAIACLKNFSEIINAYLLQHGGIAGWEEIEEYCRTTEKIHLPPAILYVPGINFHSSGYNYPLHIIGDSNLTVLFTDLCVDHGWFSLDYFDQKAGQLGVGDKTVNLKFKFRDNTSNEIIAIAELVDNKEKRSVIVTETDDEFFDRLGGSDFY